jgi:hypothetical protein
VDCVKKLASLVGLSERIQVTFDWPAVEASLSLTLPDDYKALAETFPEGSFQGFISLIRPGDFGESTSEFLGYYAHRLDDMRRWREDDPQRFPLPIFPEPGGLLPWGKSHRGDIFFWLTGNDDPNTWPVITTDIDVSYWSTFSNAVCSFLVEVVSGRFNGAPYEMNLAASTPWFQVSQSEPPPVPPPPRDLFWLDQQMWQGQPENKFSRLSELLGPGSDRLQPIDWERVEKRLDLRLPSDYKAFVDTYGSGTFGDITIASPDAPVAANLYDLIDKRYRQAFRAPERQDYDPPIHPEPGGMIAWGYTPDGWTCHWAPTGPDPDLWGIVVTDPSSSGWEYSWGESFSSLLVKYADPGHVGIFVGRDSPRPDHISFTPAR